MSEEAGQVPAPHYHHKVSFRLQDSDTGSQQQGHGHGSGHRSWSSAESSLPSWSPYPSPTTLDPTYPGVVPKAGETASRALSSGHREATATLFPWRLSPFLLWAVALEGLYLSFPLVTSGSSSSCCTRCPHPQLGAPLLAGFACRSRLQGVYTCAQHQAELPLGRHHFHQSVMGGDRGACRCWGRASSCPSPNLAPQSLVTIGPAELGEDDKL